MDLELDQLLESNSDKSVFLEMLSAASSRVTDYGTAIPIQDVNRLLGYNAAFRAIDPGPVIGPMERLRVMVEKSIE